MSVADTAHVMRTGRLFHSRLTNAIRVTPVYWPHLFVHMRIEANERDTSCESAEAFKPTSMIVLRRDECRQQKGLQLVLDHSSGNTTTLGRTMPDYLELARARANTTGLSAMTEQSSHHQISLTVSIVSAYVSSNAVQSGELPNLIGDIHRSLGQLAARETNQSGDSLIPAVPAKKSVYDRYIICLEDGGKYKSLKRHIRAQYGLTPDEYREKWNLPPDYPMVAPSYAARRSTIAKATEFWRKRVKMSGKSSVVGITNGGD